MQHEGEPPVRTGREIEILYRKYHHQLVHHAMQITRDQAAAEDACHSVFVRLLRRGNDSPSLPTLAYLQVAIRHECLNLLRQARRLAPLHDATEPPAVPRPWSADDDRHHLLFARWRTSLSSRQQAIIDRWNLGETYKTIATALGLTAKTVNTHLERAKTKLRLLAERERGRMSPRYGRESNSTS